MPLGMAAELAGETAVDTVAAETTKMLEAQPTPFFEMLGSRNQKNSQARTGRLLGVQTPTFTMLTSRGMPMILRPRVLNSQLEAKLLYELPISDLLIREDLIKQQAVTETSTSCSSLWPHLKGHVTYCSFRNPLKSPSVYGADAVCSVETYGGRKKVPPRTLLDLQQVMRASIVAAPGEEVPLDGGSRKLQRAVSRSGDWLKEILDAKANQPELNFEWHVLASIQGGADVKLRQKACSAAASLPIAGVWIGGLGYTEALTRRAPLLAAVDEALPEALPRFLPLNSGTPVEVLQAVLLGVDVLEINYPVEAAHSGLALVFESHMPSSDEGSPDDEALLGRLLASSSAAAPTWRSHVRQMQLRSEACREDFGPICEASPVRQYSRAYLYHLLEACEMLGTMLLVQHNLHVYSNFFAAIREHIQQGSLRQFASWFLRTQTAEPPEAPPQRPQKRSRKN
mmetsp:Transcript_5261/g.7643  ORF Transcript_5261/g.7643 Transcript_5261/m.7643 type:complete len:455 (-) Transcript_5261:97-1461(-)